MTQVADWSVVRSPIVQRGNAFEFHLENRHILGQRTFTLVFSCDLEMVRQPTQRTIRNAPNICNLESYVRN
jgi:hypothetical protein